MFYISGGFVASLGLAIQPAGSLSLGVHQGLSSSRRGRGGVGGKGKRKRQALNIFFKGGSSISLQVGGVPFPPLHPQRWVYLGENRDGKK